MKCPEFLGTHTNSTTISLKNSSATCPVGGLRMGRHGDTVQRDRYQDSDLEVERLQEKAPALVTRHNLLSHSFEVACSKSLWPTRLQASL